MRIAEIYKFSFHFFLLLQNIEMMIVKTGRLSCILGTQSDWLVAGGRLDKWEHFASEMGYRIKFVPIQLALCHQVFHVIALCLMFGNATFSIRNRNYQMKFVYRFVLCHCVIGEQIVQLLQVVFVFRASFGHI